MLPPEIEAAYVRDGYWRNETLPQRAETTCAKNIGRVALLDGDRQLGFEEAWNLIERLAGNLAARGVAPGDVVSWRFPNSANAGIIHHAVLRAGATSNPLNPALGMHELKQIAAEATPKLTLTAEHWKGISLPEQARAAGFENVVSSIDDLLAHDAGSLPAMPADPSANALLLYTSGTTSRPKGVLLSHRALLCEMDSFPEIHGLTPEDRYLGGAPVSHIAGLVYGLMLPFAHGTSTVLLERWDARVALETIERRRATFMTGPPTFLQTLADARASEDLTSFRLFSTGGASIHAGSIRAAAATLGCVVKRAYGSTEVPTLTATMLGDDERARLETDGRAIGGGEIRIEDGEIWARAPEMFSGYRDTSIDAFEHEGWFRTGDIGVLDADGLLHVTGRIKDIIIRGGENISAKEIEDLVCEHPLVVEAAVVGMPDTRLGERVCVFVTARDPLTLNELNVFLLERGIAKHKLPERLEIRKGLPKTESGKVLKSELRALL